MASLVEMFRQNRQQQPTTLVDAYKQKTAYQQNMAQPVQQPEQPWTTRRVMGNISKISAYDQPKAQKMYDDLMILQGDPTSKYYNPYTKATNKSVSALGAYGVDVSNIDDKFFADNDYLLGYLSYNGTTNTPTKPGKKASDAEKAAYEYYQIKASEEATRKVETQWQALQDELSYWAKRKDRNYSDDDIIDRIDWKKYGALVDLDEKKALGKPTALNRGTTYSKDAMYGVLWAARNGGSSGSIYGDMARSANGDGNAWQFDQNIADRLNPKSTSYSPYSVGSTLDDAAVYFGVDHFDREWLVQNDGMQYGQDETAKKMYQKVLAAEETTSNAEKELADLNEFIDKRIARATKAEDADKILNRIDWNKYPTLAKMDKSIGVGDMPGSGDLLAFNRAIDYRYADIEQKVREGCAERAKIPTEVDYVDDLDAMTGVAPVKRTDIDSAIANEQDGRLAEAADLFDGFGTESEQKMSGNLWASAFGLVKNDVANNENSFLGQFTKLTEQTVRNSISKTSASILEDAEFIAGYEQNVNTINELDAKRQELEAKYGDSVTHFGFAPFNPNAVDENGDFSIEAQAGWNALTDKEQASLKTMLNTAHDPSEVMDVVADVYNSYIGKHEAENEAYAEYSKVVSDLDNAIASARENEARYNEAIEKRNDAEAYRTAVIDMLLNAGVSNEDLKVFEETNTVVDALRGFTEYEPTQWEAYNAYDLYAQQMAFEGAENYASVFANAKAGDDVTLNELETARWLLDYSERYNISIPDNVRNNLNRYIAKLERNHEDYEYFSLLANEDFKEGAERGYEMAFDDYYGVHELDKRTVGMIIASNLMTPYEQDTYYYLLSTEGKEAAEEYYNHLADGTYGVLTKRNMEAIEAGAAEIADQGFWGRRAADVMSMILSPAAAIGSFAYGIEQGVNKLLGNETEYNPNNPWLSFNKFKTASRDEIRKEITETYGEGTMLTKLATSLQEMVSNRGDSLVNAVSFGWLTGGISGSAAQEFVGAIPMATSAAFDAMSEAKEKGASDDQAWAIGGVTLFAESITEAVTLSNIKEAFKAGEDITGETIKTFLKDWLTKNGIEEAFGESVNDIIENYANEKIMGELSDHAQKVREYEDAGMSPEEAEAAARRDELSNVLHTAIISYLSPGLDIVSTGAGRLNYYKQQTKLAQQAGYNVSLLDIMTADKERTRQITPNEEAPIQTTEQQEAQQEEQTIEQPAVATEQVQEAPQAEPTPAMPVNEADLLVEQTPEQVIAADYQLLDNAAKADLPGQTATIAAVLDAEGTDASSDQAKAAAALADRVLLAIPGNKLNAIEWMQNLWIGASETKVDINAIKQAFQTAILGGEESAAYKEMRKGKFRKADFDAQANRLAATVEADAQNQAVQDSIAKNVREARIVEAEGQIIARGEQLGGTAVKAAVKAQQTADKAAKTLARVKSDLESRQSELEAATAAAQQASEDLRNEPSAMNSKRFTAAIAKFNSITAVVQEYQQSLAKAETDAKTSEENARTATEEAMTAIRQQAEAAVIQQDQERAGIAQEQAAIAQQQAEEQAQQEIVQNEIDNSNIMDADAFIEQNYADASEEERQRIREAFNKVSAESITENGTPDAIQRRDRFVQQVSKKFGINIEVADTTQGGVVDRQNGYYDRRNNRIVLDQGSSIDDAMFFVLGHELTHVAEASQSYKALASTLVRMKYGFNEGQLAADIRARKSLYDERLARMHEQDNSIDATPLTEDEAAQEIVADIMGDLLHGDTELVNRLVAEEPSMARRIISSIKSFLRKAVGMKGAWVSDAQRTVDMLEAALKDAQARNTDGGQQYSLSEAQPITDTEGNEVAAELPGGTVSISPNIRYSFSSFDETEREKARDALYNAKDEDGNNRFTKEEVDNYIDDALGIASIIASDRGRLDFTADPEKTMLKPNAEYVKTLDASTLCAKRLLYQGTFDAIQHLLPNSPLMPEDLIDLSNLMRDMGYETPCGICYVESRRRQLGKFTEQWLADYDGEYKPTLDQVTTSDGLEELRSTHPQAYQDFVAAMNKKGTMNPKVVQLRTDYRGEIRDMTPGQIQKVKDIGGLRIQSFSDFETPHLLDMVQAVMDMAAKNLTAQAYTKVPNFPWAFGDTGIKINLSLIGKGEGVDANGNLIFDDVEGMPFEDAMKLRERYSKNVGTILVGINDKHILAAMADPRIDFVIPFHKSGWSKEELNKMPVLNGYSDYTDSQNEKIIIGKDKNGKYKTESLDKSKKVNFQPVGENGYWDFTKTGKENAEEYLRMCAEDKRLPKFSQFLVDNGDGSFSLQPDGSTDGYWKTLIDFKMYDNDGVGSPQQAVTPNINMEQAERILNEYTLERNGISRESNNDLPVAQPVVDRYVEEYKKNHPLDENRVQYSLPSNDLLEQQIRQYIRNGGSIANQNQRTAPAPRFNERNTGTGIRQWGNEGAQASDELFQQAKDAVFNSEYTKDTNAAELNRALDWIQKNRTDTDPDGYNESMRKVTNPSFNYRSKDGQARMIAVMALATAKNDINGQVALADAYNRQGTALGQALQARKIWRLMTPEGRIASLRKMLSDQQIALYNKGNYNELKLSDWVYQAAAYATEEGEFEKVQKAAAQELANQLPRDWKSMFRAWRMLSMLGNPRTHIRNIVGNALFIPSVGLKNKIGALMEIGSKEKTKTLAPFLSSEARSFARADATALKDILTGEAKYNEGNLVERERKPFNGLLQAVIDFNGNALEAEDWFFLKGHYRRALGGWMMANGYSADYLRNNPSVLEQGRAYAVQEAQKATYRDANKIAQNLNKISREGGALGFVVDATLPFKKTPANILRRGVEYSPVGIMRSLTTDLYHLKQWRDAQKANAEVMPEKAISPTQFIDRICSGLSGTAVMVMGALLGNMGIVSCGLDDDDDELEKAKGNQKYSFKFSIAGEDFTYTMDWAAPMSMPFFVGAAIQEQMQNEGDVDINDIVNAMGNITEPVFNLSMLDGINTLFKTSQYDDTNTLTQIGAKVVSNYVTSYVPSLLGAIARTVDDTQRKNFVKSGEGTGITGTFNYAQEQVENKIPGMSQKNIPIRDIWGNANTSSLAERIIENFISPGYINSYEDDPLINEMARLYDITGDKGMIPSDPVKSFTYNKQKYVLEAEQWDRYKEVRGQTAYQMMTDLLKNSDYQKADAGVQTQMIKDVWSYADKVGRQAIIPDYDLDTKSVETISTEGIINGYKDEMMKALAAGDLDTYDTMVEALHELEVEDKDIKTKIANVYRDKYKDAYRKNDNEAMNEIEYILEDSGFDFDIDAWEDQVDKKYNQ